MKRGIEARLGKAEISLPGAVDLRGLGWAAIGAARFFMPQKYCHWLVPSGKEGTPHG